MIVSSMVTAALISGTIAGGSQVASSVVNARASGKASRAEQDAAQEALDFERQQFDAETTRLQPYRDLGTQSYAKLAGTLGLDPNAVQAPPPPLSGAPRPAVPRAPQAAQTPATFSFSQPSQAPAQTFTFDRTAAPRTAPTAQSVRVRHPRTGEVREVPAWQAQALVRRGGQVV